ncbi:MAG TPA: 1-deoxy-D-xylulose-5-phosphate reductoisomerase [Steroidobacteraceae bacterium]|nr:1-deoxy-D-xylulose-5-phosphate reductoisomerase [Steroidobacteraceae bacterium]
MKGIAVLGSTGSIGRSTLDVIARHPDRFRVVALGAATRWEALLEQCRLFRPEVAVLLEPLGAARLAEGLRAQGLATEVLVGADALVTLATWPSADTVMAAIVGSAGLLPTLAAARAGKRVLLANKEALVMSGRLLLEAAAASGAELLPIDSEHNAIFQCLPAGRPGVLPRGVRRVWLTASGGPFLRLAPERLAHVTVAEACAHPRWVMGRKISVDSATLMNKGLELIEAHLLFGLPPGSVEVVIHPESVVHSLVEYADGSVLAQLGNPDMRTPIAYALAWPERIESGVESLDLVRQGALRFEAPDRTRFRCLALAEAAARSGGTAPAILNAANEVAVAAFLGGRLNFTSIATVIERVLERLTPTDVAGLEEVLEADRTARRVAAGFVTEPAGACA